MMVTTANSVVSAPLTQKIEYRPFKAGVEMAEFSWSTIMHLWCSGNTAVFQTALASSILTRCFIIPICGGKHTQRTQNASSERNCGFVSHQIDYRHVA